MKTILFILGMIFFGLVLGRLIFHDLKPREPLVSDHPMIWSTDRLRADGSSVTYFWYDPTGDYPYTKDTCCLDSIVHDNNQYTPNCWANATYDSVSQTLDIIVQCDSLPAK